MSATRSDLAYVVGNSGLVMRYVPPLGVPAERSPLPQTFALVAYPNPFNNSTTLSFALPFPSPLSLKLFDLSGREMQSLVDRPLAAGEYRVTLDASAYASGSYFARLNTGQQSVTTKLILLK